MNHVAGGSCRMLSTLLLSSVNMSVRGACLVKRRANPFLVDADGVLVQII